MPLALMHGASSSPSGVTVGTIPTNIPCVNKVWEAMCRIHFQSSIIIFYSSRGKIHQTDSVSKFESDGVLVKHSIASLA